MSNRKLTKFPVIAEDGTEYRVTLKEMRDRDGDQIIRVKIYLPRKRFGFKKVDSYDMLERGRYDRRNPDYVAIARYVFEEFSRSELSVAQRKSAAIDAFQAWDGRL